MQFIKTNRFNEVMGRIRTDGIDNAEQVMLDVAVELGQEFIAGAPFPVASCPLVEHGGSRAQFLARWDSDNDVTIFYQKIPFLICVDIVR